jgi:peptidoglycan-N-acetylglucosamine deacetylase
LRPESRQSTYTLEVLLPLLGIVAALALFVFWVEPLFVLGALERITPHLLYRVRTDQKLVALSFDDGPAPVFTPQVLEILQIYNAKATFFLIGERAARSPELVARIKSAGHEVGNHYSRNGLILFDSDREFLRNLERAETAVGLSDRSAPGAKLFRPPGGWARPRQVELARQRGYITALGDAYPHDPMRPPVWYIRWLVQKNLAPGTIIILHDGISRPTRTIEALPGILAEGRRRGFSFVSIGELMKHKAARHER